MKISCPSCAAKYSVADEKIRARLAKIRCRKCSSTIVIDGNVDPPAVRVAEAAGAVAPTDQSSATDEQPAAEPPVEEQRAAEVGPAPGEYAVDIADNDQRNMTVEQLVEAYNTGVVTGDTYIWKEGMPDWQVVAETPEVCAALHEAARKGGAAPPAPLGKSSADLFGGIDKAGGEDEIATSAPVPQQVVATGARNESSVLFSLSALTGQAEPTPKSDKPAPHRDDSGLIDLQALTNSGTEAGSGLGASPFVALPLGAPSSLETGFGGVPASAVTPPPARKSMALWLGAGAVALALVALLVVNGGFRGPAAERATAPTAEAPPAEQLSHVPVGAASGAEAVAPKGIVTPVKAGGAPSAEPLARGLEAPAQPVHPAEPPAAELKVAEDPAPTPAKAEKKKRASKPRARRRRRPATKRKTAAAPTKKPAPKPRARSAKKATPCNCKPTDLMCAMRCSAKK